MHHAPAVTYPVGRSHFQAYLLAMMIFCELLTLAAWCWVVDVIGWPQVVAGGLIVAIAAVLLISWWRTPQAQLSWQGAAWTLLLNQSPVRVEPELLLDLQVALLLRLRETEKTHVTWVWLERSSSLLRWLALRRAVYDLPGGVDASTLASGHVS